MKHQFDWYPPKAKANWRNHGVTFEQGAKAIGDMFMPTPMRPMTDDEIAVAAAADSDASPMSPEQLQTAKKIPRIKTLRRALGLTQEEFATRYHIPVGTLRDWEQGRSEPDQPARAYLAVIAGDAEGVARTLAAVPR